MAGKSILALVLFAACGTSDNANRGQTQLPATNHPITDKPNFRPSPSMVQWLPKETKLLVSTPQITTGMRFLAVGKDGTAYATKESEGQGQLFASSDNARTWKKRGDCLDHAAFRTMTVLSDGTLLADIGRANGHTIARSENEGHDWTDVLPIGQMSMLTPHSVAELDGTAYFGEYQAYTNDSVPIHLWASSDSGKTWELRQTFDNRRHCHGVRADAANHALWVFFGDNDVRTGMVRSTDAGHTFSNVLKGRAGSAVDAVFTSNGILFGQDVVFGSDPSYVQLFNGEDAPQRLLRLPGPSYSIHPSPVGGLLLTTTREPAGDVYLPGDDTAHLLASPDGVTWQDLLQMPRIGDTTYGRANIYWTLPSNEVVMQTSDVNPTGPGYGYMLLKVERD